MTSLKLHNKVSKLCLTSAIVVRELSEEYGILQAIISRYYSWGGGQPRWGMLSHDVL